jgi:hypothetical protein
MKIWAALLMLMTFVVASSAQTNVYNITHSQVTINNITIITNVAPSTNIVQTKATNSVVIPRYYVERLQWEDMLEARRRASFSSYLRRFPRN